ncbi:calcium-binding protein [Jannaschia seohaensis]|uniref:Hemolysin type calcium-binding protein n=1 Tax=Jannaschia seohaensis TaxID=475081 RepID=A0A2Y9C1B4_9RHOB|nr:calcium-binding protein [Jannaschia seohaensis]PWJ17527.1 hemolysin type calcium-binding protein [Jannaschia seohaensis]SSA47662.1 Hemolysin-type calcium-binding repeat-containing protein [Jannaschia seohaensis]
MTFPDADAARTVFERARDIWLHIEDPRDYVDYPDLPSVSHELGRSILAAKDALDEFLASFGEAQAELSVLAAQAEAITQAETAWRLMREIRQGGDALASDAVAAAEAAIAALGANRPSITLIEEAAQAVTIASAVLAVVARVDIELAGGTRDMLRESRSYLGETFEQGLFFRLPGALFEPESLDVATKQPEVQFRGCEPRFGDDPSTGEIELWWIVWNGTVSTPLLPYEIFPTSRPASGRNRLGEMYVVYRDGDGHEISSGEAEAWTSFEARAETHEEIARDIAAVEILDAFHFDLLEDAYSAIESYHAFSVKILTDESDPYDFDGSTVADILFDGPDASHLRGEDGNDRLFGGVGDDSLSGGADDDRLDGGPGADEMRGGPGDDLFLVDDPSDTVFESRGQGGFDFVRTSVDFSTGAQEIEHVFAESDAGLRLAGGVFDQRITGGAGDDTLSGGEGADDFLFDRWPGKMTITDFGSGDRLIFDDRSLRAGDGLDLAEPGHDLRPLSRALSQAVQEADLARWDAETGTLWLDLDAGAPGLERVVMLGEGAELRLADIWLL